MYTVYIDMFRLYWSITSSQSLVHVHTRTDVRIFFTIINLCWGRAEKIYWYSTILHVYWVWLFFFIPL